MSPNEIVIAEEAVNTVDKDGAANAHLRNASFDNDVDQVKPQTNAIEWKIPEQDETRNSEFEDPLKSLGEEMKEGRAEYLAGLRKIEDGYAKRLTFG